MSAQPAEVLKVGLKKWPAVVGEFETVRKINKGFSIARFGDGEFKMMEGNGYVREKPSKKMTAELVSAFRAAHTSCLIGIPTMDPAGDKYPNWSRHIERFRKHLLPGVNYYSAFISRPDCGTAWLETLDFAKALQSTWLGKSVAILCESDSKLLVAVSKTNEVRHVECQSHNSYARIDEFERELLAKRAEIVLLSCGPTATCLAKRLAPKVQALDLGSVGAFLCRWL